ncbi:ATP-binding cassette sub-family A member 2-like isoform X2 [Stegodyphus dumicola]|nr:ATP-binding cassette sub-family A member 2-like isoform X2 [Stegodyphus dumicola]
MDHIDQEIMKTKILKAQEQEFFSGRWLQHLIGSSDVLVHVVEHLGASLKEIHILNIYDIFHLFTKQDVVQGITESFGKLIEVLDPVFTGSALLDTLEQVMDGLKSFVSLAQVANFSFTYSLKDIFGEGARDILTRRFRMDPRSVSSLMESEVDLKQAKIEKNSSLVTFCRDSLDQSIPCVLSSYRQASVSVEYLQDLVLQRFLFSFGSLGVEGVLREADVNSVEAERTLEVLSSAPEVVNKLTNHLETVTTMMHPEVRELFQKLDEGTDWLATPEALSIGGQILCGKPLTSLSRKFSLLAPEDTENKIEEKEVLRLPTEFCRHGYKEIMKMRGGAILWGFLKPLFRGKILYSPKNFPPAITIISKVNETLKLLEDQMRFVKAAAEGSTGLHYLQRKNETLISLQKFLASKPVSKLLGSPSWGAALSWLEAPKSTGRSLLHLVELVGNVTQCISLNRFLGFDTEEELEAAAATLHDRREFIAAIVFQNEREFKLKKRWTDKPYRSDMPKDILYKIRMDIDNVPTTEYIKYRWWRPYPYDDFFEDLRYFRGFLQLQDTVDTAIMQLQTNSDGPQNVKKYLQQFPYPCHQRDKFGTLLKGSMPAVMTISWVFIVALLVRERVLDRELELDETLRVMGLKGSASWLAWFVTGVCVLLVSVIGIVLVLKWGGITPNSDPIILFLFVLDFAILLIAYCQLMSAFFTRATTAALMSVLLYVLSFFPFLLFVTWELDFLYWQKLLSCALVSTSFCFGCLYLNRYEDQGQGVQWSNLWHSPVADDRMNFGTTLMAMVLCSLGYFLISWYFTRIWAGSKERKPLTWYFFMSGQKYPEKNSAYHSDGFESKGKNEGDSSSQREQNVKKIVGISVKNVHGLYTKRGSNEWKALCGLNLDLCEDHITALLGHNGAGKTTTIKILTGRMSPTAGSVTVYGLPIPEKIAEARKLIGFCPQNNTLYAKLTVREHLYLFAQLKGLLDSASIDEDVEKMLQSLNLEEKQHQPAEVLSGGQRRRLCVGIAFIGDSKVIILDEPTSSVDPVARRSIWDLILKYKKGRTILLTTHHLDEADILSDRVAILHKGRVLCYGSPLQLKSRFGSGYRLSLLVGAEKTEREDRDSGRASSITEFEEPINVDCDGVMEFIQSYVPDATLLENDESHLVVSLPVEPLNRKPLSEFFAHLEKCLHLWGFQNSSLSSATLEEVFLTLCRLEDAKEAHKSDYASDISPFFLKNPNDIPSFSLNKDECHKDCITSFSVEMSAKDKSSEKEQFLEGAALKFSQLKSLVKKRYWHTKRNWKALTSSILMPCLFIALAMALAVGKPQKKPDPSIELKPSLYSSHGQKAVSFFAFEEQQPRLGTVLLDALKVNMSAKQICNQKHAECRLHSDIYDRSTMATPGSRCLCEAECPTDRQEPSSSLLAPDQTLYNVSGLDVPRYLLNSYLQFNERRYGGWSMKKESDEVITKVWFENSGYHSAPSYLNTLNNAILKNSTGKDFNIRTWSHPLRLSVEQLGRETLLQRLGEVGIAFVFLIGLSLVPSTFAVYVVGERESEQKRLQMVTGALGPLMYWGSALLWDLTIVLVTSLISAAIVGAFALPAFYQRENFRAVYALIFLYGWATTPLTYLCSRFFHEGSLAFMVIFTSHLFVGLVIMMALVSLRMISISKDIAVTLELVQKVSLAFPQYSLVGGLTDLNENQIRTEIFAQFGQDVYLSPFGWNSLGPNYVSLFIQGLLFFLLTLLLEILPLKHWCQRLIFGSKRPVMSTVTEDDSKFLLQIQNISQVYPSKAGNKYAVDNLSLNIPVGECFGLVGANGAGKTTLFRLLIGEIRPTSGRILRIGSQSKAYEKHRFLGYCPQKDALDPLLTARQHLEVYAGLRGIHPSQTQKLVDHSLQSLELSIHADCPVRTLSGGTKRKLCTAIATMGDPELVLLDEPTSGMDPGTRRLVWRSISQATEAGRSVILTSHSIEDCDVLCSRLGIMVNGKIACLDSPAKLKARLGTGYIISFRIPEDSEDLSSLLNFIHKEMPTTHIQVRSKRRVEITLPDENLFCHLSNLFCHLEECAKLFGIEDLAIDPTTLDQVFVTFVRQQSDASERNFHSISQISAHENEPHLDMCCTKL